ncbi:SNF2 domain protein [Clostridium botulinum D str. 1873]|uniref:SNF2 domain protein n=1 Tax=Clostridium botulinum D str. 1873 TaxID=592027 RepID=A0A9P2G836_CLOBO|nr:SNF2 domain protein [Clostridium botulinum D str. 1873]
MDLWSEIYLLDGGARLGKTITGYRERYFKLVEFHRVRK